MTNLLSASCIVSLVFGALSLGACEFDPPGSVLDSTATPDAGGGPGGGQALFVNSVNAVMEAGCGNGNGADCHASTGPVFMAATPAATYELVKSSNLFAGFTYTGSTVERKLAETPPHKGKSFDAAQLAAINTWLAEERK